MAYLRTLTVGGSSGPKLISGFGSLERVSIWLSVTMSCSRNRRLPRTRRDLNRNRTGWRTQLAHDVSFCRSLQGSAGQSGQTRELLKRSTNRQAKAGHVRASFEWLEVLAGAISCGFKFPSPHLRFLNLARHGAGSSRIARQDFGRFFPIVSCARTNSCAHGAGCRRTQSGLNGLSRRTSLCPVY